VSAWGQVMGSFGVRPLLAVIAILCLAGCGLPPLLFEQYTTDVNSPSGPDVASLLANIKCELWEAANDATELPYYPDTIDGIEHPRPPADDPSRRFNLRNLFEEIEYIAEIKLTLDVQDNGAFNPSANYIKPLAVPTTTFTLAVGGQLGEQAHRNINLYQSIDFQRLVASRENPIYEKLRKLKFPIPPRVEEYERARAPYDLASAADGSPCGRGQGLHGRLGLKEALGTSAIAARMQDVAVLLRSSGTSGGTIFGQTPSLSGFTPYAFGEMDTTIDFTVNADLNVGPNWSLTSFKGPNVSSEGGANGSGLVNVSRQAKDTLLMTVIPVCIRQKYIPAIWAKDPSTFPLAAGAPDQSLVGSVKGEVKDGKFDGSLSLAQNKPALKTALPTLNYPIDPYVPRLTFGTPIWANYLPPCLSPQGQAALSAAPLNAKTNLQIEGIDNLLRSQRRM